MKMKWMILAGFLLLFAGCGGNEEADRCYKEGITAIEQGNYDSALSYFEQLIESGELLAEAYRGYGIAWMEKGAYPEAIAAFSRSLNNLDGNHPKFKEDVMFYLAKMRIMTGELEKAVTVYSDMLKDNAENVQAFFLRGKVYLEMKDFDNAQKDFDRALRDCKDYDLYINIYQLYANIGKSSQGEKYLDWALELMPQTAEDYYHRGRIYENKGLYTQAKEVLVISRQLGFEESTLLLGRIYLKLEDVSNARKMYQNYLEQSKKKAVAYNGLAQCDIYEGNYDAALEHIQAGLLVGKEEELQGLLYNEIVAYEYKKEFQIAKEKMASYLEKYPDDEDALRENEFLSTR